MYVHPGFVVATFSVLILLVIILYIGLLYCIQRFVDVLGRTTSSIDFDVRPMLSENPVAGVSLEHEIQKIVEEKRKPAEGDADVPDEQQQA